MDESIARRPVVVTDDDFVEVVLGAEVPVVVDFWADWCAPCRDVALWMERLAERYGRRLLVAKVEADVNPETIATYGVSGLPTILLFEQGELRHRQSDRIDEKGLGALVTSLWPELGKQE